MAKEFKVDLRQKCYSFGLQIIKICDNLPARGSAVVICNQIIRSSTSIGANLIEAKASSSRLEFKKFYEISLKSANETLYWLELMRDAGLCERETIEKLEKELEEITKMLAVGVMRLKNKNF